jgi:hypothetical protein
VRAVGRASADTLILQWNGRLARWRGRRDRHGRLGGRFGHRETGTAPYGTRCAKCGDVTNPAAGRSRPGRRISHLAALTRRPSAWPSAAAGGPGSSVCGGRARTRGPVSRQWAYESGPEPAQIGDGGATRVSGPRCSPAATRLAPPACTHDPRCLRRRDDQRSAHRMHRSHLARPEAVTTARAQHPGATRFPDPGPPAPATAAWGPSCCCSGAANDSSGPNPSRGLPIGAQAAVTKAVTTARAQSRGLGSSGHSS